MFVRRVTHHHLIQVARQEAALLVVRISMRGVGEPQKSAITRAARLLGWSITRTEDIWRGEARTIHSFEMDMLRAMAKDIRDRRRATSKM